MKLTRRNFVQSVAGAAAATPWLIPASARGAAAPSNRINVALIGRGCMGRGHLNHLIGCYKTVQVLAVCDVDASRCNEGKETVDANYAQKYDKGTYSACAAVNDFREILARKDIDAVLIATQDHWHTPISIAAAKAGKDIYCEKPVSLCLHEGRKLVEAVQANKRVFQNGSQYRSMQTIRPIVNYIRQGGLGKVKHVFTIWSKTHVPTLGPSWVTRNPTLPEEPLPQGLDWNMWVGPAPMRPYNAAYHRNPIPGVVPWVFCSDFGAGAVTGYHSHAMEVIQYAINMETSGPVEIIHPSSKTFPTLTCRYANDVLVHHLEGWGQLKKLYPDMIPEDTEIKGFFGGLFVGERGWITALHGAPVQGPDALFNETGLKTREFSGANNHHENWFTCIKTREKPSSYEELGHRSAATGHLVDLGYRLERSLKWDPVKEEFIGDDEANRLRAKSYRAPWGLG